MRRAAAILDQARHRHLTLTTAESCTGGLVAGLLTEIPGASDVIDRGYVTYSNLAKEQMLNVPPELLRDYGAVSEPVACAMAEGARRIAKASLAVSISGVAAPGGGSVLKPVGRVHLALAAVGCPTLHRMMDYGDIGRSQIRLASVSTALELIESYFAAESTAGLR